MANIKPNISKRTGEVISYRVRVHLGLDEQGKDKFVTKTVPVPAGLTPAKAKKQIEREAAEWEAALRDGLAPTDKATFAQVVEDFFELHGPSLKPSTLTFYHSMKKLLLEYFGRRDFASIRAIEIDKFLLSLREVKKDNGEPLSPKTIKHVYTFLKVLFSFAEKYDIIVQNPMRKVTAPAVPAKKVDFLNEEQAKNFLSELKAAPLRWRTIMTTLLLLGLRRGECAGIQWQDIDFDNNIMHIERNVIYTSASGLVVTTPKTANSARSVPIPPSLAALLKEWQRQQATPNGDMLIPSAYAFAVPERPFDPPMPDTFTKWLSRFTKERNLPNVSPHDLRHSCASLLLMSGASVKDTQDFMGHADAGTTLKYYVATTDERLAKAANALADALNF